MVAYRVIEALSEAGIEADVVCGTSMGALVGAAHVAGQLPALRAWAESATWREIVGLVDVRLSGGGLIDGKEVVTFLRKLGVEAPIESHKKRFAAVATDLVSGREVWLESGPIYEAVRASIALPGIFSPAQLNGKWFVDGGLSNPVPVSVCRALGADVIIAVNLNGDLLGRRFASDPGATETTSPSSIPNEFINRLLKGLPPPLREQAIQIVPQLLQRGASTLQATSACSQTHSISCRTTSRGHVSLASRLMSCSHRDCAKSLCWSSTAERRQLPKAVIVSSRHCRC